MTKMICNVGHWTLAHFGDIALWIGLILAYNTIKGSKQIAKDQNTIALLRDSMNADLLNSLKLVVPADETLDVCRTKLLEAYNNHGAYHRDELLRAVQDLRNFYGIAYLLINGKLINEKTFYEWEIQTAMEFFFVVSDYIADEEHQQEYESSSWRKFRKIVCSKYLTTLDKTTPLLRDWAKTIVTS